MNNNGKHWPLRLPGDCGWDLADAKLDCWWPHGESAWIQLPDSRLRPSDSTRIPWSQVQVQQLVHVGSPEFFMNPFGTYETQWDWFKTGSLILHVPFTIHKIFPDLSRSFQIVLIFQDQFGKPWRSWRTWPRPVVSFSLWMAPPGCPARQSRAA